MATKPLKIALFVLRIAPKVPEQDWMHFKALFFYFPTHPANPRGNGSDLVKNAKEKGPKWKKVDLEGPDLAIEKKVRTLYYINFLSRIQPRIQKYQKALKNAISDFPHFHPVVKAL